MDRVSSKFGTEKLKIIVPAGGRSSEREVSLAGGQCVVSALRQRGHSVDLLDPALRQLDRHTLSRAQVDIVFPMLHGVGGEDGSLQAHLDELQVPYVGSSAESAALTFNKISTRNRLQQHGIAVPPGLSLPADASSEEFQRVSEHIGYPIVIKPATQGSSVGVSIVRHVDQLSDAVREAAESGSEILCEQYIEGRELTVPVVDGRVFPAIEILPERPWYDYIAKYTDQKTRYITEPADVSAAVRELAVEACSVCRVSGISRVDFRVDMGGRCFVLEINSIPGMTSHSLVPMSAAALGISCGELCEQACYRALHRFRQSVDTVADSC